MLVVDRIFLFFILFLVCLLGICENNSCQINDNAEYLNTAPLISLNTGGDANIILPRVCVDYNIPNIDESIFNDKKIGKELNICPPVPLFNACEFESFEENF